MSFVSYRFETLSSSYNQKCPLTNIVNVLEYIEDTVDVHELNPYLPEKELLSYMKNI